MDNFMDKLAQKLTAQEMIKANAAADAEELNRLKSQVAEYKECLEEMRRVNKQTEESLKLLIQAGVQKLENAKVDGGKIDFLVENGIARLEAAKVDGEQINRLVESGIHKLETAKVDGEQINRLVESGIHKLEAAKVDGEQINRLVESGIHRLEAAKVDGEQINRLVETGIAKLESTQVDAEQINRLVEESIAKIEAVQQNQEAIENLQKAIGDMFNQSDEYVHKENVKVYRNVQAVVVEESNKQTEVIQNVVKPFNGKMNFVLGISIAALIVSAGSLIFQLLTYFKVL